MNRIGQFDVHSAHLGLERGDRSDPGPFCAKNAKLPFEVLATREECVDRLLRFFGEFAGFFFLVDRIDRSLERSKLCCGKLRTQLFRFDDIFLNRLLALLLGGRFFLDSQFETELLDIARKCYDDDDISANDAVIGGIERPRLLTEVEEYIVTYNARLSPDRVYLNVVD